MTTVALTRIALTRDRLTTDERHRRARSRDERFVQRERFVASSASMREV
jgi:hypothetical protein